ncbi:hypothetical protein OH768_00010 [Streptomyces sp. NBC_01622]|uniref:hypothetical protein n=1 Tax=Streptomyces sp. NBC_01622 TaxID=2975903 RepID=UPI003866B57E|nr:hypothetical protein OH768_00010 [Streptomyces sp. NBC_01622]
MRRRLVRIGVFAAVGAGSTGLAVWMLVGGASDHVATVGGLFIGIAALILALVDFFREESPRPDPAVYADDLARTVRAQWLEEAEARRLRDPRVLPIVWATTGREVADEPRAQAAGGRVLRVRLDGRLDGDFDRAIGRLADGYGQLEQGRLVVIGEPGAGKTVLAMLLALGLLASRNAGTRVPVLLSISSWDPLRERLDDWIVRTLAVPYYGGDPEIPRLLLTHGLLLPVLDGLDEIPESARRGAIRGINQAIGTDRPLVVTCRAVEYEELIRGGAPRLRRAPVVEVLPVPPADVIGYLSDLDWPDGVSWNGVFDRLRAQPPGPVAEALSTPLMVTTAHLVYRRGGRDPAELLDEERFDCRYAVEDHLTHQVVEAAYAPDPWLPEGAQVRGRWNPEQARRWLTFLACYLHEHRERDLAWWLLGARLIPAWAGPVVAFGSGLLLACVAVGWVMVMGGGSASTVGAWALWPVVLFGLTGSIVWYAAGSPLPGRLSWSLNGSGPRLRRGFRRGAALSAVFVVPVTGGATLVTVLGQTLGPGTLQGAEAFAKLLAVCAALSTVTGLALAAHGWLNAPPSRAARVSPANSVAQDRLSAVAGAVLAGAVFGVLAMYGLRAGLVAGGLFFHWASGWPGWPGDADLGDYTRAAWHRTGHDFGVGTAGAALWLLLPGTLFAMFVVLTRAWPRFVVARWWLALRGQLPWRLLAFLADARQREILRQSGGTYQFRHIRLQEALAGQQTLDRSPQAPRRTEPESARRRVVLAAGLAAACAGTGVVLTRHRDESRAVFADPDGQSMSAVAFRPGTHELVWAAGDGRTWWGNALSGGRFLADPHRLIRPGWKEPPNVHSLAFDPTGSRLLAVGCGKAVELWDIRRQQPPTLLGRWPVGSVRRLVFHPSGGYLVGGYQASNSDTDGYFVARVGADSRLHGLTSHDEVLEGACALAILRQGELVLDGNNVAAALRPPYKKHGRKLFVPELLDKYHYDGLPVVLASPHDDCLYVSAPRGELWRPNPNGVWHRTTGRLPAASAAAFHPNQPILACAGVTVKYEGLRTDGTVELWSTNETLSRIRTLYGHMDRVTSMSFSSDGQLLATASTDGTVRLWDSVG